MKTIRCLLVDDEPPAIELLQTYTNMIDQLEVVGTSYSAVKAFEQLNTKEVDLLFLDIQMPVLNGIDFIKTLKNPPAIILTTAYREYAIDGYDLDIIDYLLKPISFDRFLKAIDRYNSRINSPKNIDSSESTSSDHVFFNINRMHHKVILDEILYIESLKDYVRVHTSTDRLLVKGNLGSILKLLPSDRFIRIHRSFAVAPAQVKAYNLTEVMVADQQLPIGVSYREQIKAYFESQR